MNDLQKIPIAPFIEPGFYRRTTISNLAYHNGPGVSKTDLALLLRSPAHYRAKDQIVETPAMVFGGAFHTYILEREIFNDLYLVMDPGINRTMKAGKALVNQSIMEGKIVLSYKDILTLKGMHDSVWAHPIAKEILSDGMAEVSGYWKDPVHPEILCKIRIDWLNTKRNILVDLKSAVDARLEAFRRIAYQLSYHLQAAFYLYGVTQITKITHKSFYFIVIEKEAPYAVQVYEAVPEFIGEGEIVATRAIQIYFECLESGKWPSYSDETISLGLPPWVKRKEFYEIFD